MSAMRADEVAAEIKVLRARRARVQRHIEELHRYNDVKDAAQTMLEQLAEMRGCRTRDLYDRFGLDTDD